MSHKLGFRCPDLIQKSLKQFETQRDPLSMIQLQDVNLYLPNFEHTSRQHYENALALLPSRSLQEANMDCYSLSNGSHEGPFSSGLRQQRLAMEGQALGKRHYANCNLFSAPNTQNLQQTIPKILPELQLSTKVPGASRFNHKHPTYLNVACLPFAQNYFSLDDYNDLTTAQTTPARYVSAFSEAENRQQMVNLGKRTMAMAHYDWVNRRKLMD